MRLLASLVTVTTIALAVSPARADAPDPALALFAGAATFVAGFAVGSVLLATSNADRSQDNAGWLTMTSAFTAAPLASHAAVGEWVRGLAFAAPPGAMTGATAGLLAMDAGTINHGSLPEQRWLWSFFGVGLFTGAVGVVDAAFAPGRVSTVKVTPSVGAGRVGLELGGTL